MEAEVYSLKPLEKAIDQKFVCKIQEISKTMKEEK